MNVIKGVLYRAGTGEPVNLPLHQTFIDATTGAGKTVLLESLGKALANDNPEYRVLFIDSKDDRDFQGFGEEVPLCFLETTEPLVLRDLMAAILSANMMYYFDTIVERSTFDTLKDLFENLDQTIKDADAGRVKIHGKELGKLRVIWYALKKLTALLDRPDIGPDLKLGEGVNVMNLSMPKFKEVNYKTAFQQLIVRSTILRLAEFHKVVFIADEAHKWIPQRWSSPVKQPFSDLASEGRGGERWVFIADQASSKVDKEPLKPCHNWIIGMQKQPHEVEDAMEMLSDLDIEVPIKIRDVKSLGIGFFWVVTDKYVEKCYARPYWLPVEIAQRVAKGDLEPDSDEVQSFRKGFREEGGVGKDWEQRPLSLERVLAEEDWDEVEKRIQEVEAKIHG